MRRVHYNGISFDINPENYYDPESLNPESVKYVIGSTFFLVSGASSVSIATGTIMNALWGFDVFKNAGLTFVGMAEYIFLGPSRSDEPPEYVCDIHDSFRFLYDYTHTEQAIEAIGINYVLEEYSDLTPDSMV